MDIPETLYVFILAVLQGIAEFLPISSSGHVLVGARLLGDTRDIIDLNIVLHFGTLLSIIVFYRQRIAELLTKDRRLICLLILGTCPAAMVGLIKAGIAGDAAASRLQFMLNDAMLAGICFVVTGFMLMILKVKKDGQGEYQRLTWRDALWIGVFQALAILPGISRSGMTIVGGVMIGLRQQSAATFAFLLAIPAISGAAVLEGIDLMSTGSETPTALLVLGATTSFVVGLFALKMLVRLIDFGRLHGFSYYLLPLGLVVLAWRYYVEIIGNGI